MSTLPRIVSRIDQHTVEDAQLVELLARYLDEGRLPPEFLFVGEDGRSDPPPQEDVALTLARCAIT